MTAPPIQPAVVSSSLDSGAKAPWRPRVSGIAGFLCGPLAAALIAFVNLRRLDQNRKAAWTLALTIVACVAFGLAITTLPDGATTMLGKVIGYFVSPVLYPFLQKHAFEVWEKEHLGALPDKGARSIGWAILGLVGFFAIVVGSSLAVSVDNQPKDIEVRYIMPPIVNVGDNLAITIKVTNTADHPQLLHSLDIDTRFLEGIELKGTKPAFEKTEPNLFAPIRSYIFKQTIPSRGTLDIEIQGHAQKLGTHELGLSVCIKSEFGCTSYQLGGITVH